MYLSKNLMGVFAIAANGLGAIHKLSHFRAGSVNGVWGRLRPRVDLTLQEKTSEFGRPM